MYFVSYFFKVTNSASFERVKIQISELEHYCEKTIPKILVGNKDDNNNEINKAISTRDACEYAEQNHLTFFEISVKDNKNITEVFNEITKRVLKRRLEQTQTNVGGIRIEQNPTTQNVKKKKCCTT